MSKYESIKLFYFYDLSLYFLIFYVSILRLFHFETPDIGLLFCLSCGELALLCFLKYKEKSDNISLIIPMVLVIPILFAMFKASEALCAIPVMFFIALYTIRKFQDLVLYEHYSGKIKQKLIRLFLLGLFTVLLYSGNFILGIQDLFRAYIVFLMISVILLREGRNYSFSLQGKKSFIVDGIILLVSFILSIKALFNLTIKALSYVLGVIGSAILFVLDKLIVYILVPFVKYILQPLFKQLAKNTNKYKADIDPNIYKINDSDQKIIKNDIVSKLHFNNYVNYTIGIIVVLILCYISYKLIKRERFNKPVKDGVIEERESLIIKDQGNKPFMRKLRNYITSDPKEKIFFQYQRILSASKRIGVFKRFMTPTALKNILKAFENDSDKLENITTVYNEAKFSNHQVTIDKSRKMKEDVDKLMPLNKN